MDLNKYYQDNKEFRDYVNAYSRKHHISVEEALAHRLVADYAEYLEEAKK